VATTAEELDREMHRPSLIMMPGRELAASGYVHDRLPVGALRDSHSDAWVVGLPDRLDAVQATLHE
jgi:hypothetical protein